MTVHVPYQPKYHPTQQKALDYLSRTSRKKKILFGGGASGGKSFLIQDWQIQRRLFYRDTRGFIGRNDLGDLRKYTIPEVFEQLHKRGLRLNKEYRYDGRDMFIEFSNKSRLYFIDLFYYPSDPNFQRFGSTAYTDGAIEEAAEVTEGAVNMIYSRLRYKLTDFCNSCATEGLNTGEVAETNEQENPIAWKCPHCGHVNKGLLPKLLMGCNPHSGHLRSNFYTPWETGTLDDDCAFVPSLATDNPHTPDEYLKLLNSLPEMDRRRLRDGDWYYDNSSDVMFQYAELIAAFNDEITGVGEYYITADIARLGKDKTVICVWHGLVVVEVVKIDREKMPVVEAKIRELMTKYSVKLKHTICDEDGIGGGVVDHIHCKGFTNNGQAVTTKMYSNIKHECYFKLADYVEKNKVIFRHGPKDQIIKELQAIRRKAPDGDTKLAINSKDDQKKLLNGNSPDYADSIMMRMYFELKPNEGKYAVVSSSR